MGRDEAQPPSWLDDEDAPWPGSNGVTPPSEDVDVRRAPPGDLHAEREVLGNLLHPGEGDRMPEVIDLLVPTDFSTRSHEEVFATLVAVSRAGVSPSVALVAGAMSARGTLKMVPGGELFLAELLETQVLLPRTLRQRVDIIGSHAHARRVLVAGQRLVAAAYNGAPVGTLLETFRADVAHVEADREQSKGPRTLWAPDLAAVVEPIAWVSKGLAIAPGRSTVYAGEGGTRKGWLAMATLLAAASGTKVLGRFEVRETRALYLDFEQTERITRERFQLLARGAGIDLAPLGERLGYRWRPVPTMAPASDADGARIVDELARQTEGIGLVVVDSVRACSRGVDENSVFASGPLDLATEVSERTGVCFVFIDHAGKPDPSNARHRKHAQRGHSSKLDAGQTLLVFSAAKGEPTLVTCDRAQALPESEWPADFQFTLVPANGGVQLQEVMSAPKPRDHVAKVKTEILDVVRKDSTLNTSNAIAVRIKGNRSLVLQAIRELIEDDGKLVQPGGKGSAFHVRS